MEGDYLQLDSMLGYFPPISPVVLRNNTTTAITITIPRTSHKDAVPVSHPAVLALNIELIAGGRMYPANIAPMNKASIDPTIAFAEPIFLHSPS